MREHGGQERQSQMAAVSVGESHDEAGGGHGGEALVEGGVAKRQNTRSSENGFGCSLVREGCGEGSDVGGAGRQVEPGAAERLRAVGRRPR